MIDLKSSPFSGRAFSLRLTDAISVLAKAYFSKLQSFSTEEPYKSESVAWAENSDKARRDVL
jgi:hypothetical protein